MPDRLLRSGIITSEKVNKLSWPAEVFYRRLMSLVDDYGRYEFNKGLLRSQLYPLKVDRVSVSDVVKWSTECVEAGLIRLYTVADKEYLEVIDFRQRLRAMNSKYPAPTENDMRPHDIDMHDTVNDSGREEKGREAEENITAAIAEKNKDFLKFEEWVKVNASRVQQMKEPFTEEQFVKAKTKYGSNKMLKVLVKMHNWKKLTVTNVSAYLTFLNWAERDVQKQSSSKQGMVL